MKRGYVKFWNSRGYGAIVPDDGGPTLFAHASSIDGYRHMVVCNLLEGQLVEFLPGLAKRGPIAYNIRPLTPEGKY